MTGCRNTELAVGATRTKRRKQELEANRGSVSACPGSAELTISKHILVVVAYIPAGL